VGEGKLFERISSHCRESLRATNIRRGEAWFKFFSTKGNRGWIRIYWKEEESEETRKVLEGMLEYVLNPKFPVFKKEFQKEKRSQSKMKQC